MEVLVGEDLMLMCDILDERSIETVNGAAAAAQAATEIVVIGVAGHDHGLVIANVIANAPDPDHLRDVDVHVSTLIITLKNLSGAPNSIQYWWCT